MSKNTNIDDPHASREAAKYDNPIPSREYILEHLETRGEPGEFSVLCSELKLESPEDCDALSKRLNAMCRAGQLICSRSGSYGLVNKMDLVKGRVMGHKDGFGFLIPEDGSSDLYLGPRQMQKVFDGDIILARVSGIDRRGRKEGKSGGNTDPQKLPYCRTLLQGGRRRCRGSAQQTNFPGSADFQETSQGRQRR